MREYTSGVVKGRSVGALPTSQLAAGRRETRAMDRGQVNTRNHMNQDWKKVIVKLTFAAWWPAKAGRRIYIHMSYKIIRLINNPCSYVS